MSQKGSIMKFAYIVLVLIAVSTIYYVYKAVKTKEYSHLITLLLTIPFFIFFVLSLFLGGNAFHNAEAEYELYEAGHYYLCSHGGYTEVTYGVYLCMMIMEIVGIITFALSFILSIRSHFRGED